MPDTLADAHPIETVRRRVPTECRSGPVPESKVRKKAAYTPPPEKKQPIKLDAGNRFLVPFMVGCFIVGLLWIVVFYLSGSKYPVPAIHNWNMVVGFGLIISGFIASMRWK
jgi:hypothetical protein